jgi:hypothetical protein
MERDVAVAGERGAARHPAPQQPFKSIAGLGNVAIAFLTIHVVFDLAAVVVDWQMLDLVDRVRDGGAVTFEQADAADSRMYWSGILQTAGALAAAVPFIVWTRRSYRNLAPLGTRFLRFKPGWAVGGWFVPFLSLARPKAIVNDVWRASDPELPPDLPRPPEGVKVPGVVNWWWAMFLAGWWLYPGEVAKGPPPTPAEVASDVQRILIADAILVVAGVLAILVVRNLSLRQEQRYARLAAVGATSVAPRPLPPGL